jgi:hypothetical protein
VGVNLLVAALTAVLLAVTPAQFLESRQHDSGGFAEAGRTPDLQMTAWATLGLTSAGGSPEALAKARGYLLARAGEAAVETDVALVAMALAATGGTPEELLAKLRAHRPGKLVNATIWTILALRQAGEPAPPALATTLRRAQHGSGGWAWLRGGAPDTNDTAVAIQALRAAGVTGAPIRRGVAYLRAAQRRDGGFGLTPARASDAQSTAWAIQAFLAAGVKPGAAAYRYLAKLRREDGSYSYSARYATTPVWVTSQVLPAVAGKPFPLRSRS